MRVILDLDEKVLETLGKQADAQMRSRKNFMELVLINQAMSVPTSAYTPPKESLSELKFKAPTAKSYDGKKLDKRYMADEAAQFPKSADSLSDYERTQAEARIKELEAELKNPPKNPQIGIKKWIWAREQKIEELKKQLQ